MLHLAVRRPPPRKLHTRGEGDDLDGARGMLLAFGIAAAALLVLVVACHG